MLDRQFALVVAGGASDLIGFFRRFDKSPLVRWWMPSAVAQGNVGAKQGPDRTVGISAGTSRKYVRFTPESGHV